MDDNNGMPLASVLLYTLSIGVILAGIALLHHWPACWCSASEACSLPCVVEALRCRRRRAGAGSDDLEGAVEGDNKAPPTEASKLISPA